MRACVREYTRTQYVYIICVCVYIYINYLGISTNANGTVRVITTSASPNVHLKKVSYLQIELIIFCLK